MLEILGKERAITFAGSDVGIEEPLIADQTSFKQDPVLALVLLDVKPALFLTAISVGPKNRFQSKCARASDGVRIHQQAIVSTVEQHSLAAGDIDKQRATDNRHRLSANCFKLLIFQVTDLTGEV